MHLASMERESSQIRSLNFYSNLAACSHGTVLTSHASNTDRQQYIAAVGRGGFGI